MLCCTEASDFSTDTSQKPGRRRNKQQPASTPAHANPPLQPSQQTATRTAVPVALSHQPDTVKPTPKAGSVKAPDKQKAARQNLAAASSITRPEETEHASLSNDAVLKQQHPQSRVKATAPAQLANDGVEFGLTGDGAATKPGPGKGSSSAVPAASTKAVRDGQAPQRQHHLQPQSQQPRQGSAVQTPRSAASHAASSRAGAGSSTARPATNYSAAVSGLAQSTAALKLQQADSAPQQTGGVEPPAPPHPARPFPAQPAAASSQAAMPSEQSKQPRSEQQQRAGAKQQQQQQQFKQQQLLGQQRQVSSWDSMPVAQGAYSQQGPQRSPSIDWSFQGSGQAAPVPPFARNASGGSLPGVPAWPSDNGPNQVCCLTKSSASSQLVLCCHYYTSCPIMMCAVGSAEPTAN